MVQSVVRADGGAASAVGAARLTPKAALYKKLSSDDHLFLIDLEVMPDGWLGSYGNGEILIATDEEFWQWLNAAGWAGQDVGLLTPMPADENAQANFRQHLKRLTSGDPVFIFAPQAGMTVIASDRKPVTADAQGNRVKGFELVGRQGTKPTLGLTWTALPHRLGISLSTRPRPRERFQRHSGPPGIQRGAVRRVSTAAPRRICLGRLRHIPSARTFLVKGARIPAVFDLALAAEGDHPP